MRERFHKRRGRHGVGAEGPGRTGKHGSSAAGQHGACDQGAHGLSVRDAAAATSHAPRSRRRKAGVVAACSGGAAAAFVVAAFLTGSTPVDMPSLLADQVGITHANADVTAGHIQYASYASVADQEWMAGRLQQDMHLELPARVSVTTPDGTEESYDNPVVAAPHVYVDLDGDGSFSAQECVFNPVTYADDGAVEDWGSFLEPGRAIDGIELTHEVPAGDYGGQVTWTALDSSGSPCNPMTFDFSLHVTEDA